ncbi:MAG TPA: N-acetyltransferase [Sedimenticola thiotaurini]|uniref:N-acetyltransferase n=1 Tax=Sedimenticola thiotaurini TaxID=1543721 RepID=A0A831W294_9GAMM|nr:N-acetyltransferase [Sedimenticola thiotaurini]
MAPPQLRILSGLEQVPAAEWNRLVPGNHPFLRHEFLHAMERHGCVGAEFGWLPRHLTLWQQGRLVAAMPLYEKHNGYGEFVFDHAWADAWARAGLRYYPKLVSAIPYTPATGRRLLAEPGREETLWPLLRQAAVELARATGASGVHWLFPVAEEQRFLQRQGLLARHDCQFHWRNRDYRDFDHFLTTLAAKKRKNIRRERRLVRQSGVRLRRFDGHDAGEAEWRAFADFYQRLFERKWGMATFNHGFFHEVAQQLPEQVLLVLAERQGRYIAGALMYRSDDCLYGRHWGAIETVDGLHFEACYYQGIEYCIERGLQRFEPGAQGEHKLARGFLPVRTCSSHWVAAGGLRQPVARFCADERAAVADYIERMENASPYRRPDPAP